MDVKTAKVLFLDGKYVDAARMFREGAADGDAECAHNYGYCLLHGYGVERDESLAKSFFVFASRTVGEAAYNLAVMYLHGTGVARDYRKVVEYMNDAADLGVIEAQLYLGIAHTMGELFEPDVVCLSLIPFHKAEYRPEGNMIEGEIEVDGEDESRRASAIKQDLTEAFYRFRQAAAHPDDYVEEMALKGKYLYARCFIDGVGVDFDRDRGNALMLFAASEGSQEALYYLSTEAPYVLDRVKDKKFLEKIKKVERLGRSHER